MTDEDRISNDEWERRQLCPDGNCIGVIGPDGRCKECGRQAEGSAAAEDMEVGDAAPEDPPEAVGTDEAAQTDEETVAPGEPETEDDWTNRRLCPDGNCIGVIGPDGKCKECGRPAE